MKVLHSFFASITLLGILISTSAEHIATNSRKWNRVMAWFCLEFCEETPAVIAANLHEIEVHKSSLAAVSFEKYTLGPNSTLVDNQLTVVSPQINAMGLESWPLLSSFPHPPEFIDWMRQVFDTPQPFIDSCISEAQKYNYVGYNLDWEPTDDVVEADGAAYAAFIETFANQLHAHGLLLTVDVATWSPIWDYDAISATAVDRGISMGTYTSTDTSFASQLDLIVDSFGTDRAGVGLETVNASSGQLLPINEVAWRFELIKEAGVTEIDLWKLPVPASWWSFIENFAAASSSE